MNLRTSPFSGIKNFFCFFFCYASQVPATPVFFCYCLINGPFSIAGNPSPVTPVKFHEGFRVPGASFIQREITCCEICRFRFPAVRTRAHRSFGVLFRVLPENSHNDAFDLVSSRIFFAVAGFFLPALLPVLPTNHPCTSTLA